MSYWPPQGGHPSAPPSAPGAPPAYHPHQQQQQQPGVPPRPSAPGGPYYGAGAPPGAYQPAAGQPPPAYFQQQPPPPNQMYHGGAPGAPPGYAPNPYAGRQAAPGMFGGGGPPPGVEPHVFEWFRAVDADKSGRISCMELQQALVNGNWRHFNPETCRLMIGMFDRDGSGQIEVHEFQALWTYIQQWRGVFERYDRDRSGYIEAHELQQAWGEMGYRLSPNFTQLVVMRFDKFERRGLTLDNFIQASVMLKSLTDAFRQKDLKQNGQITVSFEDFLTMVLLHK